jgi:hypothetical protein
MSSRSDKLNIAAQTFILLGDFNGRMFYEVQFLLAEGEHQCMMYALGLI